MRNVWLLLVGLATGLLAEELLVSSQSPFSTIDDLYLEGRTSGELPIDDEDIGDDYSGSGSGDYDALLKRILNFSKTTVSKEIVPFQPQSTTEAPQNPSTIPATTVPDIFPDGENGEEEAAPTDPQADWFISSTKLPPSKTTTEFNLDVTVTKNIDEDSLDTWGVSTSKDEKNVLIEGKVENGGQGRIYEMDSPEEVTSENLWERTEVLAAVISCGVIGFLCAVFLLLLLAYRMKKKDEGSYDLGDTKLSTTVYHKAPTKEFYA